MQAEAAQIKAERRTGLFIDYTAAHRVSLAQLIERYVQEVWPLDKGSDVETTILESFLRDCDEDFAVPVLERKRLRAAKRAETSGKKPIFLQGTPEYAREAFRADHGAPSEPTLRC